MDRDVSTIMTLGRSLYSLKFTNTSPSLATCHVRDKRWPTSAQKLQDAAGYAGSTKEHKQGLWCNEKGTIGLHSIE